MITFDSSHRQDVEQRKVYTPSSSSGVQAILPGIKETRRSDTNWNLTCIKWQIRFSENVCNGSTVYNTSVLRPNIQWLLCSEVPQFTAGVKYQ